MNFENNLHHEKVLQIETNKSVVYYIIFRQFWLQK